MLSLLYSPTQSYWVINPVYPNQFATWRNPVQILKSYEYSSLTLPFWDLLGFCRRGFFCKRYNKQPCFISGFFLTVALTAFPMLRFVLKSIKVTMHSEWFHFGHRTKSAHGEMWLPCAVTWWYSIYFIFRTTYKNQLKSECNRNLKTIYYFLQQVFI